MTEEREPGQDPEAWPPVAAELGGVPAAPEFPPPPAESFADLTGPSGIDALFGESKFVEYEEGPSASENPFAKRPIHDSEQTEEGEPTKAGTSRPNLVLLWVAGSLVAVLALGALFMLGTKLPALLGPAPGALVLPSVTPTPTPTVRPLGPIGPGVHRWDDLLGGECLDPYQGPWENEYTVVDCAKPHPAQLVTRAKFVLAQGVTGFPGVEALRSQVNLLCTSPSVIDYSRATAYTDIQFEASYAVSEQDWFAGNQYYNCFVSRSSGGPITGSIAMPQVAPTPAPSAAPAP